MYYNLLLFFIRVSYSVSFSVYIKIFLKYVFYFVFLNVPEVWRILVRRSLCDLFGCLGIFDPKWSPPPHPHPWRHCQRSLPGGIMGKYFLNDLTISFLKTILWTNWKCTKMNQKVSRNTEMRNTQRHDLKGLHDKETATGVPSHMSLHFTRTARWYRIYFLLIYIYTYIYI